MKLLIASTAMALVLASGMGWAAGSADTPGVIIPGENIPTSADDSQTQDQAMINVMPANQIVGSGLKDLQGIDAGKIDSLVIDTKSGAVEFVMITPPSSFNAGDQLIAAPWTALNPPASANGPMTMRLSVDTLAQAPRIDRRLIYELTMPEIRDRMYGYFGANDPGNFAMGDKSRIAGAKKDEQFELGAHDRQIALADQNIPKPSSTTDKEQLDGSNALVIAEDGIIAKLEALTTTSTAAMHGSNIYDLQGKEIGEFDETMIDVKRGHIAYILVSNGGFLGMDENLYVAPIEALSLSPYSTSFRLTINAQILEHEPAYHAERRTLPSRVSAAQLATLYQSFGVQPYWMQAGDVYGVLSQPKD